MPCPVPAFAAVGPDHGRRVGGVERAAPPQAQPGTSDQDRPGSRSLAAAERRRTARPRSAGDLGEEGQVGFRLCLHPVRVGGLPVLVGRESMLAPRRPHRRRRLGLECSVRRIGGQVGRFDRVQIHRQPLRPAQPRGAVRRTLAGPEVPLERDQRVEAASRRARPPATRSARAARADPRRRPSSRRPSARRCAGCTPRASRPTRSGPGSCPAGGWRGAATRSTPSASTTGRRANAFLTPASTSSWTAISRAPSRNRFSGVYSRCRRTSYTPGKTGSGSCSSCTSDTGSTPSTRKYLIVGPALLIAATRARRRRRARDPSPPPRRARAASRGRAARSPEARRPEPAADHPAGPARRGHRRSVLMMKPSFSGLPEPDRVTFCHRAAEAGWRRASPHS